MTEYWKSYSKKFCEICKCWYADNKISAERHQMGERHKAMVQQRIRDSAKKAKDKEIADHDLRTTLLAMEQAARAAMSSKDERGLPKIREEQIGSSSSAFEEKEDNSSKEFREKRQKLKELKKSAKSEFWVDEEQQPAEEGGSGNEVEEEVVWVQAETPSGSLYYWQIFSGETRWDQPENFYTATEYAEKYQEIALKVASDNKNEAKFFPEASSSLRSDIPAREETRNTKAIDPIFKPLHSKEERKRMKREMRKMASEEGEPSIPIGLVELDVKRERLDLRTEMKPLEMPTEINVSSSIDGPSMPPTASHPYGPWIPVKCDAPTHSNSEEQSIERRAKHLSDLPEQHYGPGSAVYAEMPSELLEIAEMDPNDLTFKQKELPAEQKKKNAKTVGFRRPAKDSANKSLRPR